MDICLCVYTSWLRKTSLNSPPLAPRLHAARPLAPDGRLFINAISVRDPEHYGVGTPVQGEENTWVDGKYVHLSAGAELRRDFSALRVVELYEHEYEEPHPGARTHSHVAWILVAEKAS